MANSRPAGEHFFARISSLRDAQDCKALYNDWAKSYNDDLLHPSHEYVAPVSVAEAVIATKGNIHGAILDAGCGTGLTGVALSQVGAQTIDGVDLSDGMIHEASHTGVYRRLAIADLTQPLDYPDATYDIVTCVGTFTKRHVGPVPALGEFVRVLKPGGLMAATILDEIWESDGFAGETSRLASIKSVEIVSTNEAEYRKGPNVQARLLVLRKL